MPILLPGILALSQRARYFSFFAFVLRTFEELRLPPTQEALSDFVKLREFEFAAAVQLCPRGCGQISAGAVGKDRAGPAVAMGSVSIERRESVVSFLGGYGLYYRTPLVELGLVVPRGTAVGEDEVTPVDVLSRDPRAQALADHYRDAVAATEYQRLHMLGTEPIPRDALEEFAECACLCRLSDYPAEQAALRRAVFESPAPELASQFMQRQRSFALFLRELEKDPNVADSSSALRSAVWHDFSSQDDAADALATTRAQWAALVMKEHVQEAFSTIWSHFCRQGLDSQSSDGLSMQAVEAMIRGPVLSTEPLDVLGSSLSYSETMPASSFVSSVTDATEHVVPEDLRTWAAGSDSAIAGLTLLFATLGRLPGSGSVPRAWADIGLQHSDRQPSLLGLATLLDQQFERDATLGDVFTWLVHRFVISAHEQIAYSKLPDFTFRFRWEGGRLRFYPIGQGRFDLADMRRQSIARLSKDMGFWTADTGGPRLSEEGVHFRNRVLA